MSAKEMFEKLGYNCRRTSYNICYYNQKLCTYIYFYLEAKTIEIQFDIYRELLKAINKQIEELGWLDD